MAKKVRNGDSVDKKILMEDLGKALKKHGIKARINALEFSSSLGTTCTCSDGRPGVLRVVGGQLRCICDG